MNLSGKTTAHFKNLIPRLVRKIKLFYYKDIYAQNIFSSKPIICGSNSDFEVHILTCKKDFLMAIWCLKTFYFYSGLRPRLVIHEDGTLTEYMIEAFCKHFVNCRVIRKKSADQELKEYLNNYKFSYKYRFHGANAGTLRAIKLLDFSFFSLTNEFLFLDSDVLFFMIPREIIMNIKNKIGFFMNDYQNAYVLSIEQIRNFFNINIINNVNTGIVYFPDKKLFTQDLVESYLEKIYKETSYRKWWWVEQTILAIIFSKFKESFSRLNNHYQISKQPIDENTISQHFVYDESRMDFYLKGLAYLKRKKFLNEFNAN